MNQTFRADRPLGYQQLSVTTVQSLTVPAGTNLILITPLTQAIRWRDDGTAPTTAIGYPLAAGSELRYTSTNPTALQVIAQTGTAEVNVVYYGQS